MVLCYLIRDHVLQSQQDTITPFQILGGEAQVVQIMLKSEEKVVAKPGVFSVQTNIQLRIEQCMTERAEDFLLKPVKLADVKWLKELIMRGGVAEEEKTRNLSPKRILQNAIDSSSSSSPSPSSSSSSSHVVSSP